jgi:sec-independent protein translocase protein TatA
MVSLDILLQIMGVRGLEWIIILVVIIMVLFGAKKLPEFAKSLGKMTGEFQRGRMEIERELKSMEAELKKEYKTDSETEQLEKMARELGIVTVGKTEDEIREEVIAELSKKQRTRKSVLPPGEEL